MENNKGHTIGIGVGVLLKKGSRILLGLRHEDKEKADSELEGEGTWTMPGGKVEFGESLLEAAKREVLEETGIRLTSAKIICTNTDRKKDKQFLTVGLLAEQFEGEARTMEPDEIREWKWFPEDDLPTNMFEPSKKVFACYREGKVTLEY